MGEGWNFVAECVRFAIYFVEGCIKFVFKLIEIWPFLLMCVGIGLVWELVWDLIPWSAIALRDTIDGVLYVVQEAVKGINKGTSFVSSAWHAVGGHGSIPSFSVPSATSVMSDLGSWFETWLNIGETCAYVDSWWMVILGILQIKYAEEACAQRRFYYEVPVVSDIMNLIFGWLGGDPAPYPGRNCYLAGGGAGAHWCPYAKFFYVPLDLIWKAAVLIVFITSFWGCIKILLEWAWDLVVVIFEVMWTLVKVAEVVYSRIEQSGLQLAETRV